MGKLDQWIKHFNDQFDRVDQDHKQIAQAILALSKKLDLLAKSQVKIMQHLKIIPETADTSPESNENG